MSKPKKSWMHIVFIQDFLNRAMVVFIGIFLLQFVQWMIKEPGVWAPTTALLIKITLLIVAVSFLIPRIPSALRIVIQMIAILIVHGVYLDYHWIPLKKVSLEQFMIFWDQNASQLAPYIFFSLVTWFVYLVAIHLFTNKKWLIFFVVLSIIVLCTRDSFSNLTLWQEVAGVMVSGSLLFVINHIQRLKSQAPDTVLKLARKPFPFLIPLACLGVLCWLIIVYSPSMTPILTDPYTAWKRYHGESVQRFIDESGVSKMLNFGNASSGYSRDDGKLGGGFQFDYVTVMTVQTSQRGYMRGETRSVYTGKGWEKSSESVDKGVEVALNEKFIHDASVDQSKLKTKDVTVKVNMASSKSYPVLFGPASIQSIAEQDGKSIAISQLGWTKQDEVIHFTGQNNFPSHYTLTTSMPMVDPNELRSVVFDSRLSPKWNTYLSLPKELPDRVKKLAESLANQASNPYDKVKNIERYLAEKYKYTSTPDMKKGKSDDFVDQFLFETQEGYCDYFSTAMVVMARSIGMPARWVKGFTSGVSERSDLQESIRSRSAMQSPTDPNGEETYVIRNADAHSWAEVYFPGWGWIPFEATAGFTFPSVLDHQEIIAPVEVKNQPNQAVDSDIPAPSKWAVWVTSGGVILALAMLAYYLYRRYGGNFLQNFLQNRRQRRFANNYNKIILMEINRWLKFSRRKGYIRHEHETMRETLMRWSNQSIWLKADLERLLQLFESSKYSGESLTREDWVHAHKTMIKLRTAMK
ncbi:DUF4129 domain-containing transglutaminase family protein [Paenibacillus sp. KN14-4R]|uniref:DUF4129 domain-containing transglutaminase family protein n=1 Tax=Paenibacillus sp. KN14-4R TaxID=3445773 RepID=UPI003F9F963E